jgi:organic radical activating enzyme
MTKADIIPAWRKILAGDKPLLSVEITKECPLRCPGCYAYEPAHLGDSTSLRQLSDFRGQELVNGLLSLVRKHRPLHLSIVGGEPLVRWRELDLILPQLEQMGVEVQLVTSAVTVIPRHWAKFTNLHLVVSVDGLQADHDRRRSPATYERLLQHIAGHTIIVHCTITKQMCARPGYLASFCRFWSERAEVRKIWFSLFTPQEGVEAEERLDPGERVRVVHQIAALRRGFPKLYAPNVVLKGYLGPPRSPEECIFAQTTACVSADFTTLVQPCQIGGRPACAECGCIASAGLAAIGRFRLAGLISVSRIFSLSRRIGQRRQGRSAGRVAVPNSSGCDQEIRNR